MQKLLATSLLAEFADGWRYRIVRRQELVPGTKFLQVTFR